MQTDKTSRSSSARGGSADDRSQRVGGDQQNFPEDVRSKAGEAMNKVADAAQQVGEQAKQQASSLAADAKEKTKGYLNQQVSTGADLANHMAESIKCAADNLDPKAPQIASLVRSAADRLNSFSDEMREQSVDDLLRTASDFTRHQPAVVFGLASLTGFFLFRALKAKPSHASGGSRADDRSMIRSSGNQPMRRASGLDEPMSRNYGA
jgi:ElaB/YqjD/DUF883 family membrane-anchored ribosome-binding protein